MCGPGEAAISAATAATSRVSTKPTSPAPAEEPKAPVAAIAGAGVPSSGRLIVCPGCAPVFGGAPAFAQGQARPRVPRLPGRPRTRPDVLLADTDCSPRAIRHTTCASTAPRGDF